MTIKEDALRALKYGKEPYYQFITTRPSYQAALEKVRTDYKERSWIDFKGMLPKFTTAEFNKRRREYQARYGNEVNIPGFSDIIHLIPKEVIPAEQFAAHKWAMARGLPSPLTQRQLNTLQYKKFRFIKALASATPTWLKTIGAVSTVLDNVEDALVTVVVLGRIAAKIAPRLLGRMVPGLGWVLLGSDILNAANIISWVTFAAKGAKRKVEGLGEKNPFHAKAAANRALKLKRVIPSFGEYLEVLQTTDQLFGVGLCLGGLMGMVTDLASKRPQEELAQKLKTFRADADINDILGWSYKEFGADVGKLKTQITDNWQNFKNEAYRLKEWDIKTREDVGKFIDDKAKETWGWISSVPATASSWFSNTLIGSMIMSTGKDTFLKEDHTKAYIMLDSAIQGLMPWWIENDPLSAFSDLRSFKFRAPEPADPATIDLLNESQPGWQNTVKWPWLDKEYATIEEIIFTYAPMIKDSFQAYALNHRHEYEAMIAGQQVVEYIKDLIRSYSDDNRVRVGMTAWWAVAEDMMTQIYLIPPDTPDETIEALADYVGQYERKTTEAPPINEVAQRGSSLGINWMRTFPAVAFEEAAEIFPEWKAIQEQTEELFVMD